MDNYNYPAGADTEDAPWNKEILEPVVVDCCVSYSLRPYIFFSPIFSKTKLR